MEFFTPYGRVDSIHDGFFECDLCKDKVPGDDVDTHLNYHKSVAIGTDRCMVCHCKNTMGNENRLVCMACNNQCYDKI